MNQINHLETQIPLATFKVPKLILWMTRRVADGCSEDWAVEKLIIATTASDSSVHYRRSQKASQTFKPAFWASVMGYMPEKTSEHVLTAQEYGLQLHGAVLQNLMVTGHKVRNGVQRVILTFKNIIGDYKVLFQKSKAPDLLVEAEETLSTRVLNDVILPALNIAATDPIRAYENSGDQVSKFVEKLKDNKHEIEFFAGLIARFVSSKGEQSIIAQPIDTQIAHHSDLSHDTSVLDNSGRTGRKMTSEVPSRVGF